MLSIIRMKASRRLLAPPPSGVRQVSSTASADGPQSFRSRNGASTAEKSCSLIIHFIWIINTFYNSIKCIKNKVKCIWRLLMDSHDRLSRDACRAELNSDPWDNKPQLNTFDWNRKHYLNLRMLQIKGQKKKKKQVQQLYLCLLFGCHGRREAWREASDGWQEERSCSRSSRGRRRLIPPLKQTYTHYIYAQTLYIIQK